MIAIFWEKKSEDAVIADCEIIKKVRFINYSDFIS